MTVLHVPKQVLSQFEFLATLVAFMWSVIAAVTVLHVPKKILFQFEFLATLVAFMW